jgi:hypothetical protein
MDAVNGIWRVETTTESYVEFIHYVERIYEAAENPAAGHYPEPQGASHKE